MAGTFSPNRWESSRSPLCTRVRRGLLSRPRTGLLADVLLYVLDTEQHYIWLTEQLSKWHRQSLEVRDREMRLHDTNEQLRGLPPRSGSARDSPADRTQAAAERGNGRRLSGLVQSGEELVRQAMRNPEFGVGHWKNGPRCCVS